MSYLYLLYKSFPYVYYAYTHRHYMYWGYQLLLMMRPASQTQQEHPYDDFVLV